MPANLLVALHSGRTFLHVQALDNGVFPVFVFDAEQRFLHTALLLQLGFLGSLLSLQRLLVREQVHLHGDFLGLLCFRFRDDVHDRNIEAADEQTLVHDAVIDVSGSANDEARRGGLPSEVL